MNSLEEIEQIINDVARKKKGAESKVGDLVRFIRMGKIRSGIITRTYFNSSWIEVFAENKIFQVEGEACLTSNGNHFEARKCTR
jgi:hypothetical protein